MTVTEGQQGDRDNLGKCSRAGYPKAVFTEEPFRDSAIRSYKNINPMSTNSHLILINSSKKKIKLKKIWRKQKHDTSYFLLDAEKKNSPTIF